jgi:hypothetical protein
MPASRDAPTRYRAKAAELRREAATAKTLSARAELTELAEQYERMAHAAELRKSGRRPPPD